MLNLNYLKFWKYAFVFAYIYRNMSGVTVILTSFGDDINQEILTTTTMTTTIIITTTTITTTTTTKRKKRKSLFAKIQLILILLFK